MAIFAEIQQRDQQEWMWCWCGSSNASVTC